MNRYNSINDFFKARFGQRVYKASLEIGSCCPNRDGKISKRGCSFCHPEALRPAIYKDEIPSGLSIQRQLDEGIDYIARRHGSHKVIGYFQSGSNTYAPADKLAPWFIAAASHPSVVGLAISTRPDCIEEEHIALIKEISLHTFVWVELGLQSAHDRTLERIGRGHTVRDFSDMCTRLALHNIPVCAHVILGLPGESVEMMCQTARFLNRTGVWGVKIHNLHILKDTRLEKEYWECKIRIPSQEEYAAWVVNFLEELSPEILIHRLNGHSPRHLTIAPKWSINKLATMNAVHEELERRDSWQGKRFN